NQGNIIQAQGVLMRAIEEPHRVRDDLTSRLAAAFEQYDNSRILLELYRKQIIPDQVRAYQGVYQRHNTQPGTVSFGDVVNAQQTLLSVITTYVTTLGQAWTSVVGLADLLQTNDLFQIGLEAPQMQPLEPVPDLDHLPILPCEHPCTTMPDPALKGADGSWPPASPGQEPPDRRPQNPANRNPLPE